MKIISDEEKKVIIGKYLTRTYKEMEYRSDSKFSRAEFGKMFGVKNQPDMSRYMNGQTLPPTELLDMVARTLGEPGKPDTTIYRLLGYSEEEIDLKIININWPYMTEGQRQEVMEAHDRAISKSEPTGNKVTA